MNKLIKRLFPFVCCFLVFLSGIFFANLIKKQEKKIFLRKINVVGANLSPQKEYIYRMGYNKGFNSFLYQNNSQSLEQFFYVSGNGNQTGMNAEVLQPEFQEFFNNGYVDGYHKATKEISNN